MATQKHGCQQFQSSFDYNRIDNTIEVSYSFGSGVLEGNHVVMEPSPLHSLHYVNTVRTGCQLAAGVDQKLILSTASNVVFQVLYSGLLISNNGLHYVANRNDPNQLVVL
jgi:hypothetical protein